MIIIITGVLVYFFHDFFKWFGKLPGDIRIEKKNFSFYFPVVNNDHHECCCHHIIQRDQKNPIIIRI